MEALFFIIDAMLMVALVYFGLRDDRKLGSSALMSPFRYQEENSSGLGKEARKAREKKVQDQVRSRYRL